MVKASVISRKNKKPVPMSASLSRDPVSHSVASRLRDPVSHSVASRLRDPVSHSVASRSRDPVSHSVASRSRKLKTKASTHSIRKFTIHQTDKPEVEVRVKDNNYHVYSQDGKYVISLGVQYRLDDPEDMDEDEQQTNPADKLTGTDATVKNILKHIPKKDIAVIKSLAPYYIIPAVKPTDKNIVGKSGSENPHIYKRRKFVMSVAPKTGLPPKLDNDADTKRKTRKFSAQFCSRVGAGFMGHFAPVTQNNCVRAWLETEHTPGQPPATTPKELYYISGLLTGLQADSECYGLAGGTHVRLMEDYFVNNTRGYLIGTLYDGASNKVPKHCGLMNKLVGLHHIPSSLLESLSTDINNYASLSTMTILETGFTFYEKFGYMAGVLSPTLLKLSHRRNLQGREDTDLILNHMTYCETYSAWLDEIYNRLCLIYTPISTLKKMIAEKQPPDTSIEIFGISPNVLNRALFKCITAYKLRQSINTQPIKNQIGKLSLYDVYQACKVITDLSSEASIKQVTNGKHSPGTNLFYLLTVHYAVTRALTDILMKSNNDFQEYENISECVKFNRVWDTPENNFALQMHRQLPGVKPEYLAERFTLQPPAGEAVHGRGTKAELAACKLKETIREKHARILLALKTRRVSSN
jgi:hypothetical protein